MDCLHCLAFDPETESCTLPSVDMLYACPLDEIDLILCLEDKDTDIID